MQESVDNIGTDIRDIIRTTPGFTPVAYSLMGRAGTGCCFCLRPSLSAGNHFDPIISKKKCRSKAGAERKANRSARSRLKKAEKYRKSGNEDRFYEEIGKAIWGYLADKLNIETSSLSREVIPHELSDQGSGEELMKEYSRILDDSEFSRFAPSSEKSDIDKLYNEAVQLIRNLENSL